MNPAYIKKAKKGVERNPKTSKAPRKAPGAYNPFRGLYFWRTAAILTACPPPELPEIIMLGRSNVGKSSLINALAERKDLARSSSKPGKTRQILYFRRDNFCLMTDLPGYGFALAPKSEQARYSGLLDDYFALDRPFAAALLLLDIRHAPSREDHVMLDFLCIKELPFALVLTKSDKLSRVQATARRQDILRELDCSAEVACFPVSAEKRQGLEPLCHFLTKKINARN